MKCVPCYVLSCALAIGIECLRFRVVAIFVECYKFNNELHFVKLCKEKNVEKRGLTFLEKSGIYKIIAFVLI